MSIDDANTTWARQQHKIYIFYLRNVAILFKQNTWDKELCHAEKYAMIIPIYKAGSRTHLDNYRSISILPVLSKVFERVVQEQVYDYLEQNKLLSQSQFGFQKGSSTQHAVTLFSDAIRQAMDTGMLTDAVFVDLSKAFDTVDHARLLSKLPIYGILNQELK